MAQICHLPPHPRTGKTEVALWMGSLGAPIRPAMHTAPESTHLRQRKNTVSKQVNWLLCSKSGGHTEGLEANPLNLLQGDVSERNLLSGFGAGEGGVGHGEVGWVGV